MNSLEIVNNMTWSEKFDLWMEYIILNLTVKYEYWVIKTKDPFDEIADKYGLYNRDIYAPSDICKNPQHLPKNPKVSVGSINIYCFGKDMNILPTMERFFRVSEVKDNGENWKERGRATRYTIPESMASVYYSKFKQ